MKDKKKIIYFFFPYYHTGGAEKLHLYIAKCFSEDDIRIYFTDRSRDNKNKKNFYSLAKCINFFGLNNKIRLFEKIFVYFLSKQINRKENAVVFGSNSRFFYSLIKQLDNNIRKVDLVHWLGGGGLSDIIIKNTPFLTHRVVVTKLIKPILKEMYEKAGFEHTQNDKTVIIENWVPLAKKTKKDYMGKLKILYVGRNTYEKRTELAISVWRKLKVNKNLEFLFVGPGLESIVSNKEIAVGLVKDDYEMEELYRNSHIIMLTSIFEGFPYVIMEGMVYGAVPITTAVGGISGHLQHGVNSVLILEKNPDKIINDIAGYINELDKDRNKLKILSDNAYDYSVKNFCHDNCKSYKKLLE